jgi:GNAT superfamily N-acetyltransferase
VFEAMLVAPDVVLLVAERDGRIVGYLLAQRHHTLHANGPVVWVEEVMVAAQHRGAGIGRGLMSAIERWGSEGGAAYVSLATRRAASFYNALGYEPSATYFKRPLPRG